MSENETDKMFELAARNKLRFTYRGLIATEDLWDLSLVQLDGIHKALKAEARKQDEESLLTAKSAADDILTLKIGIVKHVFTTIDSEIKARRDASNALAYKKKLAAIIADKQDENLKNMSIEELQKMSENL